MRKCLLIGNHFKGGSVKRSLRSLSQMRMAYLPACSWRTSLKVSPHVMKLGFASVLDLRIAFCASRPLTFTLTPSAAVKRTFFSFCSTTPKNVGARSGRITSHIGLEPIKFLPSFIQNKPASASQLFSLTRSLYLFARHWMIVFSYSCLVVIEIDYT